MLMCSIGTWAGPNDPYDNHYNEGTSAGTETVLKIMVRETGALAQAIAAAQSSGNSFQYLLLETEKNKGTITLSSEDITALNGLNVSTINLTKADLSDYAFSNSYVSYIILPYDLTKQQVKTLGEAYKNNPAFKVCFSTSNTPAGPNNTGDDATLIAYIDEAGSLADGIKRTYFVVTDQHNNTHSEDPATLGNIVYAGGGDCTRLRYLTVMGNICAKDISCAGVYDANGHYVLNGVADENNPSYNAAVGGGICYNATNNPPSGALVACNSLYEIDLGDALVEVPTDIVIAYNGIAATNLRKVVIPTDASFTTIPADFLNVNSKYIREICIPGNIKYIKTRAFAGRGTCIDYIWTTGSNPTTRYDNGCYNVVNGEPVLKYQSDEGYVANSYDYGTITLPAGLELIERFAFEQSVHVSDVYVLNTTAPECHVDAFSTISYHANNTVDDKRARAEGIITREAYNNNDVEGDVIKQYKPMAILHYPRETKTPNTQRYTDPSREYSVATGERDGNGNTLYFPSQSEFEVAFWQGTYGYLWNAWDGSRTWYDNNRTLGTGEGWFGGDPFSTTAGHDLTGGQAAANRFYINNTEEGKISCSFYDVTMGEHNQPGEVAYPSGLTPYYENRNLVTMALSIRRQRLRV